MNKIYYSEFCAFPRGFQLCNRSGTAIKTNCSILPAGIKLQATEQENDTAALTSILSQAFFTSVAYSLRAIYFFLLVEGPK